VERVGVRCSWGKGSGGVHRWSFEAVVLVLERCGVVGFGVGGVALGE